MTNAESIARTVHADHLRRGGAPYITHVQAVVDKLKGESDEVIQAAWLHDVAEMSSITVDELIAAGISREVVTAVVALTHINRESNENYWGMIKRNPIALKVKVEDMLHNLSDNPTKYQVLKYAKGLVFLLSDEFVNDSQSREDTHEY
jgi:(p)ppGpp synthase/HD superfamily hydrolase